MAHSYTPGLTVTERTTVRRRRILPLPGTVLVKVGDTVRADTAVARAELPGKVVPLNLANQLGIAPDEINDYLVKKEKDSVQKDDVLAENKPFIKWFKTEIRSPITGKVESVSTITGQVLLREPPRVLELRGYIDGAVAEVHPDQGVTVESTCSLVQGIFGIGGETSGELIMGVKAPDQPLLPEQLHQSMKGKVVVGGAFLSAATMARAQELGIVPAGNMLQVARKEEAEFVQGKENARQYLKENPAAAQKLEAALREQFVPEEASRDEGRDE